MFSIFYNSGPRRGPLWIAIAAGLALTPRSAAAHDNTRAYLTWRAEAGFLTLAVRGPLRTFAPLLGETRTTPPRAHYQAQRDQLAKAVAAHLTIYSADNRLCRPRARRGQVEASGLEVTLRYRCPAGELELRYDLLFATDPDHRAFASPAVSPGRNPAAVAILDRDHRTLRLDGRAAGLQPSAFFTLGVWHILGGTDHVLFLLGLLLLIPLRATRDHQRPVRSLLKVITMFTLAHSVTLGATALGWIHLPSRAVEATIAASIAYVAVENVVWPQSPLRLLLVGLFGLVHGLGFAHVLAEIPLPADGQILALASFNLGVEAGQLALIGALLPLGPFFVRWKGYARFFLLANGVLLVVALLWLVERLFGAWMT